MLKVKLVVVGGATEGDEFRPDLPAVLGRNRAASVPLPHPLVSRRHCELIEKGGDLFVRDLGSTNGTFVGSERVDIETRIEHGDLLTIGTVTFRALFDGVADTDSHYGRRPIHAAVSESSLDTSTITRIDTGSVDTAKKMNAKANPKIDPAKSTARPQSSRRAR